MCLSPWQFAGKRAFDIVGAICLLIITLPIFLVAAILIKATLRGPVFFCQWRSGRDGIPFRIFKFRTMRGPVRFMVGRETERGDPRITTVGRALRRMGIDELPQLFNVLRGDMSLVGPRPLLQWENEQCDSRQIRRVMMKPGITGLSQVNGRNRLSWEQRVEWDLRYIDRASLWLDVKILVKTIPVVLLGRDTYRDSAPSVEVDVDVVDEPPVVA